MIKILHLYDIFSNFRVDDLVFYFYSIINVYNDSYINDIYKRYKRRLKKFNRTKRYVEYLLKNYDCVFLTLTICDDYINDDYSLFVDRVRLALKRIDCKYFGNADIGESFGRLHFHFIVNKRIDLDTLKWKYGNVDFVSITKNNIYALNKYLNKLTNHAIKDSCIDFRVFNNIKKKELFYG